MRLWKMRPEALDLKADFSPKSRFDLTKMLRRITVLHPSHLEGVIGPERCDA